MLGYTLLLLQIALSLSDLFSCDPNQCNVLDVGNLSCDLSCNILPCNFDSPVDCSKNLQQCFEFSDCYSKCVLDGCNPEHLANGVCDSDCNTHNCGWDAGDCGYCSNGCTTELLTNDVCDPVCDSFTCMYDNDACGWCAHDCFLADLNADTCGAACNITECYGYGNNLCSTQCSPGCWWGNLTLGYCLNECNTASCNYDADYCLCSPGCTPDILQETTCWEENDPCATADCHFKNGACGICALYCTYEMLGNGVCDPECNNQDCNYDDMDCSCAPGCSSVYSSTTGWAWDSSSNQNCLVPACEYNYGTNPDPFLVRELILTQIIAGNWSLTTLLPHPDCDTSLLEEYDSSSTCARSDSCNNEAGMYCMGKVVTNLQSCLRSSGNNCIICDGVMIMDVCTTAVTVCPEGYQSQTFLTQVFDPTSTTNLFCLRKPDIFTHYNYMEMHVSPAIPPQSTGSGSSGDPYFSLYLAFTKIYATFTKVILSAGDHYYQIDNSIIPPLILNAYDPLNINSFLEFQELWIVGAPDLGTTVYWKEKIMINPKAYTTYIQNIIFRGDLILRNNCTGLTDFCYYCPLLTVDGSSVTTDQGVSLTLDEYYGVPNNCSSYNDHVLFYFTYASFFENVIFSGFRQQFKSLISSESSLNLTNVDFIKVQAAAGENVITLQCISQCDQANFGYFSGLVTELNYGYEHSSNIELGSFFAANEFNSIYFRNVNFTYNFAFSYLLSSYPAQIIYIREITGTIDIVNCAFYANYVNSLIFIDQTNLIYKDLRPNFLNISQAYSQIHFSLFNTSFSYIYSSVDFITYLIKRTVHNFVIDSVTIDNVFSGDSGIISIVNLGYLKSSGDSTIVTVVNNGQNVQVTIPPRYLRIVNLKIDQCASGFTVLTIQTIPDVNIANLTISSVYDGNRNKVTSVISQFIKSSKYLSITPNSDELSAMNCASITIFRDIHYSFMTGIDISSTSCSSKNGPAGLTIDSIITLEMSYIYIHDINSCSSYGNALSIINTSNYVRLNDFNVMNVRNLNGEVVEIENVNYIYINRMLTYYIMSVNLPPISIKLSQYIQILNISATMSGTSYGNGAFLYFLASGSVATTIIIVNSYFVWGVAENGSGGAIYLDSTTPTSSLHMQISNSSFIACMSLDGAAIFIGKSIFFDSSSSMTNIIIGESYAQLGGMISDYHVKGSLIIINLVMYDNTGLNAGIAASYPNNSTLSTYQSTIMLDVRLLKISNSYSYDFVINLNSLTQALVNFDQVNITNVANYDNNNNLADAFNLERVTTVMSRLSISFVNRVIVAVTYSNINISSSTFHNNSGNLIDLTNGVNLNFNNSNVSNFSNSLIEADKNSNLNFFNSSFSYIQGYFAKINNGVTLNCSLCDISFVNGTVISAESSSNVSFSDSNVKSINGIFVLLNSNAMFSCIRCDVSLVYDSLITANLNSIVSVMSSSFYDIQVNSNSPIISIQSSSTSVNYFMNSTFIGNKATISGCFYFIFAIVVISECTFSENSSPYSSYSGIYAFRIKSKNLKQ